jgi:flagellar hook-basal body complex protein FliE
VSAEAILGSAPITPPARPSDLSPAFPVGPLEAHAVARSDFGQLISRGLGVVNQQLLASQVDLQRLATGDVQNLHQIMIRLEESRLSFQLLLQVRSRVLEAYQDILKMQV